MERYDYREDIKNDIKDYLQENAEHWTEDTRDETEERLRDILWTADNVTGNGSGSYTFGAWQAEENLCHNLDLLGEALSEFGCSPEYLMNEGPEACDVTIRCYLLGECLAAAMDALDEEGWNDGEEG